MKKALLEQEKVIILVPLTEGDDPKGRLSVTLNGYRLDLPKNAYIKLPEQVAEIIMKSQSQTVKALKSKNLDGADDDKIARLSK